MCGIAGYLNLDNSKILSHEILARMMDAIIHRGPDESGEYVKGPLALGHRRLSIIDLATGRQPMASEDGRLTIIYNGEIYNFLELKEELEKKGHKFVTHSDTEVILHAYEEYGVDLLSKLNGMFSFALWDESEKRLFLARDRFGKKPLYYAVFGSQFIFGSELKAILEHPAVHREIDRDALRQYLAYEYIPAPKSIFKNIYKLEEGSYMIVQNGNILPARRYWDLDIAHSKGFSVEDAKSKLYTLLKDAVKRRLISDVPLGVFLSGGIDSSTVVALMAELMDPKDIKTFSIGFSEKSFDESSDARAVASYFGTDHHEEVVGPETMLSVLPKITDMLDEPFADSSIIPTYLVSRFTRKTVTVALGGDGGDELFLGYPSFLAHKMHNQTAFIPAPLKRLLLNCAGAMIPHSDRYMSLSCKVKRFARGLGFPEDIRHQVWIGAITPQEQNHLFAEKGVSNDIYARTAELYKKVRSLDPLDRAIYLYIHTYLTGDILTKVDRASMATSLEVRAPFLDVNVAEFAATIPPEYKLKGSTTKWILKEAFKDKLPLETINKRKQGFAVPVAKWLREDLKEIFLDTIAPEKIRREGIFDPKAITSLKNRFFANKEDMRKEIWALFVFEKWYDRWMR